MFAVYGFPESHPSRCANDDMLQDILVSVASQTCPSMMAGDLNASVSSSRPLALSSSLCVLPLSPFLEPTSMKKNGVPSKGHAIDLALGNMMCCDLLASSYVDRKMVFSDHYPVILHFRVSPASFRVVKWPQKAPPLGPRVQDVPFNPSGVACDSFLQWQRLALDWLAASYATKFPKRVSYKVRPYSAPKPRLDMTYCRLIRAQRAACEVNLRPPSLPQLRSLRRKILALSVDSSVSHDLIHSSLPEIQEKLGVMVQEYCKTAHSNAMKEWKRATKVWSLSTKHVFKFVKNPTPMVMPTVDGPFGPTNHPDEVDSALTSFWGAQEKWPDHLSDHLALDNLENRYAFLLPRYEWDWPLKGRDLALAAKFAKNSSPGVDAWTIPELKALPEPAWDLLLHVLRTRFVTLHEALVLVVRRVPIQKDKSSSSPHNVRPIDIYSAIMRVFSRAVCNVAIQWKANVFHEAQHAMKAGINVAIAKIAYRTEVSLLGLQPVFSISVDFAKMFNNLSPVVGGAVARYMGLSDHLVSLLVAPLANVTQSWRLPFNGLPQFTQPDRGLPQGMSGSVVLAECSISPVIWRVHHALTEAQRHASLMVAYVDDLNFMMGDEPSLRRTIEILVEFERDFGLSLAPHKTKIWSSDPRASRRIADTYGFETTLVLDALGGQWKVASGASPEYVKETQRIREAEMRLVRVEHLEIGFVLKLDVLGTSVLSLLDFLNHPSPSPAKSLRILVKRALQHTYAAPEVLLHGFCSSTVDPYARWLMSGLRLWFHVLTHVADPYHVNVIVNKKAGRLGILAAEAAKMGILIEPDGFVCDGVSLRLTQPWFLQRKILLARIKLVAYRQVAMRRPNVFGGLESIHTKAHRKLLNEVDPFRANVLVKLWTGAAMTRHKRAQITQESAVCECGHPDQTIWHILWMCPCRPPPPVSLIQVSRLCPSRSVAHLLPSRPSHEEHKLWKESCLRASDILTQRIPPSEGQGRIPGGRDSRGHDVELSACASYTFCRKCYISRRTRDAQWIFCKPCKGEDVQPVGVGGVAVLKGHEAVLSLRTWKTSALRPMWTCQVCQNSCWATSGFKLPCE